MDRNCQENQQDQKGYHNDDQEDKIHQICQIKIITNITNIKIKITNIAGYHLSEIATTVCISNEDAFIFFLKTKQMILPSLHCN